MDPDVSYTIKWTFAIGTILMLITDVVLQLFRVNPLFTVIIDIYIAVAMLMIILSAVMFK
mgnify:CR=1 FL=1